MSKDSTQKNIEERVTNLAERLKNKLEECTAVVKRIKRRRTMGMGEVKFDPALVKFEMELRERLNEIEDNTFAEIKSRYAIAQTLRAIEETADQKFDETQVDIEELKVIGEIREHMQEIAENLKKTTKALERLRKLRNLSGEGGENNNE